MARLLTLLIGWGLALYLMLQVSRLPGAFGHAVCGPWGCGPPLQSLLACHGFWIVLFTPPTWMAARRLPRALSRRLGYGLVALACAAVLGIGGWDAATWLPVASDWQRTYFAQRWLFAVATLVEAPTLAVLLAGIYLSDVPRCVFRNRHQRIAAARAAQAEANTEPPH